MGADLFESYVGSVVATMAIGAVMMDPLRYMSLPIVLIGIGLIASLLGIARSGSSNVSNPQSALRYATYVSGIIFIIGAFFATKGIVGDLNPFYAVLAGILAGILIGLESEYYTSGSPVRTVANASTTGRRRRSSRGSRSDSKATFCRY